MAHDRRAGRMGPSTASASRYGNNRVCSQGIGPPGLLGQRVVEDVGFAAGVPRAGAGVLVLHVRAHRALLDPAHEQLLVRGGVAVGNAVEAVDVAAPVGRRRTQVEGGASRKSVRSACPPERRVPGRGRRYQRASAGDSLGAIRAAGGGKGTHGSAFRPAASSSLPLAQLLRRSLNGKSAVERHNNAYYAAEAALKLAAAARIGVWLDRCIEPGGPSPGSSKRWHPSAGHWAGFLRDVDRALAGRPDCATLLPATHWGSSIGGARTGHECGRWRRRPRRPASSPIRCARSAARGFVGFFNLVVAYRNEVMGHGAQRRTAHYERFGELFLGALEEVFGGTELFGGLRLGQVRLRVTDDSASSDVTWQDLTGLAGMPLADPDRGGARLRRQARIGGKAVPVRSGHGQFRSIRWRSTGRTSSATSSSGSSTRRSGERSGRRTDRSTKSAAPTTPTTPPARSCSRRALLEALTDLLDRLRGGRATAEDLRARRPRSTCPGIRPRAGAGGGRLDRRRLRAARRDRPGRHGHRLPGAPAQRQPHRRPQGSPPSLTGDKVVLARFRREIAVLARCDHPNVVRILTSGADGDRIYTPWSTSTAPTSAASPAC